MLQTYPIRNANMSVSKTWHVTDQVMAMFAVQATNITPTPTFANINTNITQANFGAFTSVYAYNQPEGDGFRQMDMRLRFTW